MAPTATSVAPGSRPLADELLDELLPEELEWQRLVNRYPRVCLLAALGAGAWLGYRRGRGVLAALGAVVTAQVASTVGDMLADE